METFDFEAVENRLPYDQVKWDPASLKAQFGAEELLPAWVADMDWKTPPAVREAIAEAAENGMYGYTRVGERTVQSYLNWQKRRNGWSARAEWFCYSPGVVTAINMLLLSQTKEGDEVLIQRPVYYPFATIIQQQKRTLVNSPLIEHDGRYEIDFADFEKKAASPNCKAFILSNPHNPVGRVFTETELRRLAEICLRHHVFVIADEIHSDLLAADERHVVFASLGEDIAQNCAVCHAPSKTFNLAGLAFSCIMIPNEARRQNYQDTCSRYGRPNPTFFAPVAARAAWDHGEEWLEACKQHIWSNERYVRAFVEKTWSGRVRVFPLEGTYLLWMDFRGLEPDAKKLENIMLYRARVALDEGYIFGEEGAGFERLNLAAPRRIIEEVMRRIAFAFSEK